MQQIMKAIPISLNDYILSGGGANGDSFNHREDPTIMLKLYKSGKIKQPLHEMELSRKVFQAGIPCPEPGDYVVTEDGRYGIRFRRIDGKVSFSRATGDNPERAEEYARAFADMSRQLHATHLDTSIFTSTKDSYLALLKENPFYTSAQKDIMAKFIADVPDTDTAIHGDLQFSNAIFTPDGKRYFIDLGDFGYGYPLFDLGMVYITCKLSDEAFISEVFHMSKSTAGRFWEFFARAYFGSDRPLKDIEEEVMPFAGLKTLIIERDTKVRMDGLRVALKPILG